MITDIPNFMTCTNFGLVLFSFYENFNVSWRNKSQHSDSFSNSYVINFKLRTFLELIKLLGQRTEFFF